MSIVKIGTSDIEDGFSLNKDVTPINTPPVVDNYEPTVNTQSIPKLDTETYIEYIDRLKEEVSKLKEFDVKELDLSYNGINILNEYNPVNIINGELSLKDLLNTIKHTYGGLRGLMASNQAVYTGLIGDVLLSISGIYSSLDETSNRLTTVTTDFSVAIGEIRAEVGTSISDLDGRIDVINSFVIDQEGIILSAVRNELNGFGNYISQNYASIEILNNSITSLVGRDEFDQWGNLVSSQGTSITQLSDSISLRATKEELDTLTGLVTTNEASIVLTNEYIELRVAEIQELQDRLNVAETNIAQTAYDITLIATESSIDTLTGLVNENSAAIIINSTRISSIVSENGEVLAGVIVDAINGGTAKILGDKITISGETTFEDGYNPTKYNVTFVNPPTTPYRVGDSWIRDGIIYTCQVTRLTGNLVELDWANVLTYGGDAVLQDFIDNTYISDRNALIEQIDGKLEYWFQAEPPHEDINWGDDDARVNDIWYNVATKISKRWARLGTSPDYTYDWVLIEDADAIAALESAAAAQDTADKKRIVFTEQPESPYSVGDLWLTSSVPGEGDLFKCINSNPYVAPEGENGTYIALDWVKATRYTDDEEAKKKSTIYRDSNNDPSNDWTGTNVDHAGDIWYKVHDFGGDIGEEIQPHYWGELTPGDWQWILDVVKVDGGNIIAGTVTSNKIVVDTLLAEEVFIQGTLTVNDIIANMLYATGATIGGFKISNEELSSEDETGKGIFLKANNYEIFVNSFTEGLGESSVSIRGGALTGTKVLAAKNTNSSFNGVNPSSTLYRTYTKSALSAGVYYTYWAGYNSNTPTTPILSTVPLGSANMFPVDKTGKYSVDLRFSIGTKHHNNYVNGRFDKLIGYLDITITRILYGRVEGTSTDIELYRYTETNRIDRNDPVKGSANTQEELYKLSVFYPYGAKINIVPETCDRLYWKIDVGVKGDIKYKYWATTGLFNGGREWRDAGGDIELQHRLDVNNSIKPSLGITELTTAGFQSVWTEDRYFRINGNAITDFIESKGLWRHNDFEIVTTDILGTQLVSSLDGYATQDWVDGNYILQGSINTSTSNLVANHLELYGNLTIRGEVNQYNAVVTNINDAFLLLNNGNSEVDSGIQVDTGSGISKIYRKAADDNWYIDTNKIALYDGNLTADNSNKLGGFNAADYTRRNINEIITGDWTFYNASSGAGEKFIRILKQTDATSANRKVGVDFSFGNKGYKLYAESDIGWANNLSFKLGYGSINRLTITPDGNVGIGTENPSEKLDVVGNIKTSNNILLRQADTYIWGGGHAGLTAEGVNYFRAQGVDNLFRIYENTIVEKKVAIGKTTAPTEALDVNGNVKISGLANINSLSTTIRNKANYKEYSYSFGGGVDMNWKKVATLKSVSTSGYKACNGEIELIYENGNHGQFPPIRFKANFRVYYAANGEAKDESLINITQGGESYIRLFKIGVRHYELQVRQAGYYSKLGAILRTFISLGDSDEVHTSLNNGSTTGNVITPHSLDEYFGIGHFRGGINVNGNGNFSGDLSVGNKIALSFPGAAPYFTFNGDNVSDIYGGVGSRNSIVLRSWISGSYKDLIWTNEGRLSVGAGFYPKEALDVLGNQHITGSLRNNLFNNTSFSGQGWKLDPDDNGKSHLVLDKLTVRGRMDVYELVINQIRATNGSLWVSDAIKTTTTQRLTGWSDNLIQFNFDDDNGNRGCPFVVGDIIKAQRFTGRNIQLIKGVVYQIEATYFRINTTGYISNYTGSLNDLDGLEFVRVNSSVDGRKGALYLTSSDNGSPFMDVIFDEVARLRVGKLDGITGQTGYGIWGSQDGLNTSFAISSDGYAKIAGFNFNDKTLSKNLGIYNISIGDEINGRTSWKGFHVSNSTGTANRVTIGIYGNGTDWGISGYKEDKLYFRLGGQNIIAGIGFDDSKLYTSRWSINKDGSFSFANGKISGAADGSAQIAGFNFDANRLSKTISGVNVWMGNDYESIQHKGFGVYKDNSNFIRMITSNGTSYLQGKVNTKVIFDLRTSGQSSIAGIGFDDSKIFTTNWFINKDGSFSFGNGKITGSADGNLTVDGLTVKNKIQSENWDGIVGTSIDLAGGNLKFGNVISVDAESSELLVRDTATEKNGVRMGNFPLTRIGGSGSVDELLSGYRIYEPQEVSLNGYSSYITSSGVILASLANIASGLTNGQTYSINTNVKFRFVKDENILIEEQFFPFDPGTHSLTEVNANLIINVLDGNNNILSTDTRIITVSAVFGVATFDVDYSKTVVANSTGIFKLQFKMDGIGKYHTVTYSGGVYKDSVHSLRITKLPKDTSSKIRISPLTSVTELSAQGFQSVWGDDKYFRIYDKVGITNFIESRGTQEFISKNGQYRLRVTDTGIQKSSNSGSSWVNI